MRRKLFTLVFSLVLIIPVTASFGAEGTWSFEIGNQLSLRERDERFTRFLSFSEVGIVLEKPFSDATVDFRGTARAEWDANHRINKVDRYEFGSLSGSYFEILPRELYTGVSKGVSRTSFGLHQISWGETFGFQILDIVNPRDLRDPLILETGWTRRPTLLLQQQFIFESLTIQLLYAPRPEPNLLPSENSAYDSTDPAQARLRDSSRTYLSRPEYGGRVSHLFSNGVDLGVLYYEHYNRNTLYELTPRQTQDPPFDFVPYFTRVKSTGGSLSYSISDFVLRADFIGHFGQPLPSTGQAPVKGNQFRSVLGADWSHDEWIVGAQYQIDRNEIKNDDTRPISSLLWQEAHWVSFQVQKNWLDRQVESALFLFQGINNDDLWIQPRLDFLLGQNTNLSFRYDYLASSQSQGRLLSNLKDSDRFLSWITYKF